MGLVLADSADADLRQVEISTRCVVRQARVGVSQRPVRMPDGKVLLPGCIVPRRVKENLDSMTTPTNVRYVDEDGCDVTDEAEAHAVRCGVQTGPKWTVDLTVDVFGAFADFSHEGKEVGTLCYPTLTWWLFDEPSDTETRVFSEYVAASGYKRVHT